MEEVFINDVNLTQLKGKLIFSIPLDGTGLPEVIRIEEVNGKYVVEDLPFTIERYENMNTMISLLRNRLNDMKK